MDKLNRYCQIVQKILTEYQQWAAGANEVEIQQNLSFDRERDQYLWFYPTFRRLMRESNNFTTLS